MIIKKFTVVFILITGIFCFSEAGAEDDSVFRTALSEMLQYGVDETLEHDAAIHAGQLFENGAAIGEIYKMYNLEPLAAGSSAGFKAYELMKLYYEEDDFEKFINEANYSFGKDVVKNSVSGVLGGGTAAFINILFEGFIKSGKKRFYSAANLAAG